ncbi:MAG: AAA family ATPase [Candidatus Omnitrophica bacterium]|nr:AAA family ATPase [Candidatus Omnitrophota bacterium]
MNQTRPTLARHIDGNLDFNAEFAATYDLLENSGRNVFVTGEAGTGKSTLLQYFREHTTKNAVVLAPTGVAAVNVRGQTIHSFFRFRPDVTADKIRSIKLRKDQRKIYKSLAVVVIDEVSMVRADLLDCVDAFLRLHGPRKKAPFGGVQMIFFGDLFQLPPVVTRQDRPLFEQGGYAGPYFFNAKCFVDLNVAVVTLTKIYRQKDEGFIRLLNRLRNRQLSGLDLNELNQRVVPGFEPRDRGFYINLTTTNALADRINAEHLEKIPGKPAVLAGEIEGEFQEKNLPTKEALELKIGAQVMLLNNDAQGRWVNGSIGKVLSVDGQVCVELSDGQVVDVDPYDWEMYRFVYDEETESLVSEPTGSFRQYPLRLAWAVTIHKAQGQTFSQVVIDFGSGAFSHGQAYVALSRCVSLSGVVLRRPVTMGDVLLDERVVDFMKDTRTQGHKTQVL